MANPRTIARVEAQIQRRAAHCLQAELADPRAGFVTITKVEASQDLSSASIHYSVLGSEADRCKVEHMLEEAGGFIQRRVASSLRLRNAPRLHWRYDESIAESARMDLLIREARDRDRQIRGDRPDPGEDLVGPDDRASPGDP
jgi:ribosome-binding factor A